MAHEIGARSPVAQTDDPARRDCGHETDDRHECLPLWRDPRAPTGSMSGPICEDGPGKRTAVAGSIASGGGPPLLDDEALGYSSAGPSSAPMRSWSVGGPTRSSRAPGRHGSRATRGEGVEQAAKYVASTTQHPMGGTTVLSGDVRSRHRRRGRAGRVSLQARAVALDPLRLLDHRLIDGLALLHLSRGCRARDATVPRHSGPDTVLGAGRYAVDLQGKLTTRRTARTGRLRGRERPPSLNLVTKVCSGATETPPSRAAGRPTRSLLGISQ